MCLIDAAQSMFHYHYQKTLAYIKDENGTVILAHLCETF